MKIRIDCRFWKSLGRTVSRLTGTKILQKTDLVCSRWRFFCFQLERSDEQGEVYIVLCDAAAGIGIVEGGIAIVADAA